MFLMFQFVQELFADYSTTFFGLHKRLAMVVVAETDGYVFVLEEVSSSVAMVLPEALPSVLS